MSATDEAVVRRFYEQMCNERKNDIAPEVFAAGHKLHDPQVPAGVGPGRQDRRDLAGLGHTRLPPAARCRPEALSAFSL